MGLVIDVEHVVVGDVAIFDTNRSLSGQDGETFRDLETTKSSATFPSRLAAALFAALPDIESVYVYSNTAAIKRPGGWSGQEQVAAEVISNSLVFYDENKE